MSFPCNLLIFDPLNIFGLQYNYQAAHKCSFFTLFLIPPPEDKCSKNIYVSFSCNVRERERERESFAPIN